MNMIRVSEKLCTNACQNKMSQLRLNEKTIIYKIVYKLLVVRFFHLFFRILFKIKVQN